MRAQLYGVFGTLSLGMNVLAEEGVELERMFAHGGLFRTAGVAQRFLAGALATPVSVAASAKEAASGGATDLDGYLRRRVFDGAAFQTVQPDPQDVAGFAAYLADYRNGLAVQRTAVEVLP
jgi:sugar (pentulose or hexulose) kinase